MTAAWAWVGEGRLVADWCDAPGGPLAGPLTEAQARALAVSLGGDPGELRPLSRRVGAEGEVVLLDDAGAVVATVRLVEGRAVLCR